MTSTSTLPRADATLPWAALLALGTAVFITSLTETIPAGVLPHMASSLDITAGEAGQSVTAYAAGTALTAIPLVTATAHWARKPLLLGALLVFTVANTLTAVTPNYPVLLVSRVLAGVAAGLAWALLAGYARRIAPEGLEGRAIAVTMVGIPLALSLGVPAGTLIGQQIGWRVTFGAITGLTVIVMLWTVISVPSVPAASGTQRGRVTARTALSVPGMAAIMAVVVTFVLGHTVIYAYVAPYLEHAELGSSTDLVLLVFGAVCLVSIWYTGRHIDTALRHLTITAAVLFTVAVAAFSVTTATAVVWAAAVLWGLGWGGVPTLLQTAAGQLGGKHSPATADAAQAILVTLWNAAMAAGGVIGGILLQGIDITAVPITAAALGLLSLVVVLVARRGFPSDHGDAA
ncbi:MFS transporter [Saccharomonospora cyanea]|uniref:Arabinose efflux permease family protein n=1 Tax=Saccharomonospora cyanea NA-134 TaxID=882082 RepID=H5XD65_9PSEU|nr:MFS transporter [Saccharomonospora cyanea]EHR59145.1 arabinose efflux permease family protein [Saccharomonospora cyanea NA-134]